VLLTSGHAVEAGDHVTATVPKPATRADLDLAIRRALT
jgi:hypothetical protein